MGESKNIQLTIFDFLQDNENLTSTDLDVMIRFLQEKKKVVEYEEERAVREKERPIARERRGKEQQIKNEEAKARELHIEKVTSMELPLDWNNFYAGDHELIEATEESISDGLVRSLSMLGKVDIEYISMVTGVNCRAVIEELRGAIFQNPETWGECFYQGWESAEEYLSGNIRQKLRIAQEKNDYYHGYFDENVKALSDLIPEGVSFQSIHISLSSPWIPVDVIELFIQHIKGDTDNARLRYRVKHDENSGFWKFGEGVDKNVSYACRHNYGTRQMGPMAILLETLNGKVVTITKTVDDPNTKSGKRTEVDYQETYFAQEKQRLLNEKFQEWVGSDTRRRERLTQLYEEKFLSTRARNYNGSFLKFPRMSESIKLYGYQKDAVARILFSPNTLLAHDVGAGKTHVMIAAGMELKRMKVKRAEEKLLYVVPNGLIGQWKDMFMDIYPDAVLFCVDAANFTSVKKENTLRQIKEGRQDATLITYSCFTRIPISKKYKEEVLKQELEDIRVAADRLDSDSGRYKRSEKKIKEKLHELAESSEEEQIYFDDLGITRLFVDEAHNFKNLPIETKNSHVKGISRAGSQRCKDMLDKVRIVQRYSDGGGVVFATATPVTNSITDVYVMQKYLQEAELTLMGLSHFDSWAGMFAEMISNFEIDVDTTSYRMVTRFAKFHNIPELAMLFAAITDFHSIEQNSVIPLKPDYQDVVISKTAAFADYLNKMSTRADLVRNHHVNRKKDNLLKITTDGRMGALDLRLVDSKADFSKDSKVYQCASNVARIYFDTQQQRSTQLIFCDTSTPKDTFNIYDEVKRLLMEMRVPEVEIAYIHDAVSESSRKSLFRRVRNGSVRVLIGSTSKLGLGVNVQDKLIAIHHLDVPWRPADMVQREGRMLRQGNENKEVKIFRYITEGSFDAYSWQILETKQRFICEILSGIATRRSGNDIADTVLEYAEVKALAIGNPTIKERVEVANELSKCQMVLQKENAKREQYEKELLELPIQQEHTRELIRSTEEDALFYAENKIELTPEERKDIRLKIHQVTRQEETRKEECVVATYQGFEVVVPESASVVYPIVYLRNRGVHLVKLSDREMGDLRRIDNCLNGLAKHVEELKEKLKKDQEKEEYIKKELSSKKDYESDVNKLKKRLNELDKILGIEESV